MNGSGQEIGWTGLLQPWPDGSLVQVMVRAGRRDHDLSNGAGRAGLLDALGFERIDLAPSEASRTAGMQAYGRMATRTSDRDDQTTWATRVAQYDAVCAWGIPNHALLERVGTIKMPVFVTNGDSDPMILPHYSYLLAGLIPHARLKIYPDSAHGFLFQHHLEFADDVNTFLTDP